MLVQGVAFVVVVGAAAATSRASDWDNLWLLGALLVLAVGSDALALRAYTLYISGSFAAIVLAMALLGPAPAVMIGVVTIVSATVKSRPRPDIAVANLLTYATFPLIGGLVLQHTKDAADTNFELGALFFGVFLGTNILNFLLIYGHFVLAEGKRWMAGVREILIPVLPVEIATGLLTAAVFLIQEEAGPASIVVMAIVVLVFQYLLKTAIEAFERGKELEDRNTELAALQMGLISTMLKTLSLRDHMTARHSAAVARYARVIAEALELDERERDIIHTAALFHDIGKFIFPDSILLADRRLTDEEFEIVRLHPEVGAEVIGEIDGYGPVAEIVRHHHERIDGRGYPDRIGGENIPLGSRIIAIADTYDVITARDTYRKPVSTSEAFAELRRSAGTQLDAQLVEVFIEQVVSRGIAFHHGSSDDFEAELSLERRVSAYAAPRKAA